MRALSALSLVAVLLSAAFLSGPALAGDPAADAAAQGDVLAAIDKARKAVEEGRDTEAVAGLQAAIGLIQARAAKGLAAFLPTRDAAQWESGEIEVESGNWGTGETSFQWSQVKRRYTQKGEGGPEVTVMITNSPLLIQAQSGMLQMLKDPAMRAMLASQEEESGQKIDFIEEDGWLGMVTTQAEESSASVLHDKVMVTIEVNAGKVAILKEFWAAIDRKGLAAAVK